MLKLVTALCQDVEMEVRAAMCAELDSVARGVGYAVYLIFCNHHLLIRRSSYFKCRVLISLAVLKRF